MSRITRLFAACPVLTLILLLAALMVVLQIMSPGIINERWLGKTVKFAIPLAMLAACQTLTMYTGGIDLSAAAVATITSFVTATQVPILGPGGAILLSLLPAVAIDLFDGFGIGVCRVHPLIMTLGSGLIGMGFLPVYQRYVIASGSIVPDGLAWLGTGRTWGIPNALVLFIPFAAVVIWAQMRSGFGRLLYALGANERAARLSGVRAWQVYLALYTLSGLIAGVTGLVYVGLIKPLSLSLAEPLLLPAVAAAVIGGTLIFGGRGSYAGTIVGALILTVLNTLLTLIQMLEGGRRSLFGLVILGVTAIYVRTIDRT